jgi:hypothetical protein
MFFDPLLSVHLHHGVEALLRGGDERLAREVAHSLAERAETNGRVVRLGREARPDAFNAGQALGDLSARDGGKLPLGSSQPAVGGIL